MICPCCKIDKDKSLFPNSPSRSSGVSSYCKQCSTIKSREWRSKNLIKVRENKSRTKKLRKIDRDRFMCEYLSEHPCVDCGNDNIMVLEFDHINDNKEFGISDGLRNGLSLDKLQIEMNKCEVRCSNCHRIRHAIENNFASFRYLNGTL